MKEKEIKKKIEELKDDEKISKQIDKNKSKAEDLLNDKKKMEHFLERLERKLSKIPFAGKYLSDVPVFISLVKSYVDKEYTEIPIGSIIAIISGLIYLLSPIDIIPDVVPGFGIVDDAAVIALVYRLVHDDIEEYKLWKIKIK
ncbi:MAG: YkvA family protein [Senegalia sp. (in: firmicutes)]|uniref:YkvA family protein n=1 Tax=Senegalia sp. (in: firmicutes) TaxID=1924098 RepID=UPI003F948273